MTTPLASASLLCVYPTAGVVFNLQGTAPFHCSARHQQFRAAPCHAASHSPREPGSAGREPQRHGGRPQREAAGSQQPDGGPVLRVLELYSGIGGMHFALQRLACEGVAARVTPIDINLVANTVYSQVLGVTPLTLDLCKVRARGLSGSGA